MDRIRESMTANPVTMLGIFRRAYPVIVSLYHTVKLQETEKTRARIESLERNEGDVQTLHRAWTNMEKALWRSPRTYQPSFYLVDAIATLLHRVTPSSGSLLLEFGRFSTGSFSYIE